MGVLHFGRKYMGVLHLGGQPLTSRILGWPCGGCPAFGSSGLGLRWVSCILPCILASVRVLYPHKNELVARRNQSLAGLARLFYLGVGGYAGRLNASDNMRSPLWVRKYRAWRATQKVRRLKAWPTRSPAWGNLLTSPLRRPLVKRNTQARLYVGRRAAGQIQRSLGGRAGRAND